MHGTVGAPLCRETNGLLFSGGSPSNGLAHGGVTNGSIAGPCLATPHTTDSRSRRLRVEVQKEEHEPPYGSLPSPSNGYQPEPVQTRRTVTYGTSTGQTLELAPRGRAGTLANYCLVQLDPTLPSQQSRVRQPGIAGTCTAKGGDTEP